MPVPPQTPIISYLSPDKNDRSLSEFYNAEVASYTPLDLGTPHPNTRDYPGYRFALQRSLPTDHRFIQRIYVKDESNPDFWNYEEKFSAESNTAPIYLRKYREDKKTYAPRTKLTPLDTVVKVTRTNAGSGYIPGTFPVLTFAGGGGSGAIGRAIVAADGSIAELVLDDGGTSYTSAPTFTIDDPPSGVTATGEAVIQPQTALLVAEEAAEYPPDSEFFGLYFNVTRVYETLPGPILTTKTIGQDNLTPAKYRRLVRTEESGQPVAADYAFPPGITGDQTQIQLAQETIAKARLKIISEIIAITGDAILGGETGEFGALSIYETVVNEGTAIDEGFLILKSTVTAFGNGKAVKITVKYPTDLRIRILEGQELDQTLNIGFPFQERIIGNGEEIGDPGKNITPIDYFHSRVRELNFRGVAALSNYVIAIPNTTSLRLPDILTGFDILEESTYGNGDSTDDPTYVNYGGDHSFTIPFRASSQGSVIITKEVVPHIVPLRGAYRDTTSYMFFLPMPITRQQVIDRLQSLSGASVVTWPVFNEREVTFVIVSRRVSAQVSVGNTFHETSSGSGFTQIMSQSDSTSREIGLTVKTIRVPPTIHDDLSSSLTGGSPTGGYLLAGPANSPDLTVTATVNDFLFAGVFGWGRSLSVTENAWVKVFAFGLEATGGATGLPGSGLLIVDVNARPYKYGWAMIQAETLDASTL